MDALPSEAYSANPSPEAATLAEPTADAPPRRTAGRAAGRRRSRWQLPVLLLVCTCLSTFWAGTHIHPRPLQWTGPPAWWQRPLAHVTTNGGNGLLYMVSVMGILLAHEMGHFVFTVRYRVPASLPLFIPMPIGMLGTMGAVIAMDSSRASRRQVFDIGIAGPLAGLAVAVPVLVYSILHGRPATGTPLIVFHDPWLVRLLEHWLRPDLLDTGIAVSPLYLAAWMGMLVTGLNMMPMSQLDGGHVVYAVFGRRAHLVARGAMIAAIAAILIFECYLWTIMLVLVIAIGVDHPRARREEEPLGWPRTLLGAAALAIPILCFPPRGISLHW